MIMAMAETTIPVIDDEPQIRPWCATRWRGTPCE